MFITFFKSILPVKSVFIPQESTQELLRVAFAARCFIFCPSKHVPNHTKFKKAAVNSKFNTDKDLQYFTISDIGMSAVVSIIPTFAKLNKYHKISLEPHGGRLTKTYDFTIPR